MSFIYATAQGFVAPDIVRKHISQWNIIAFGATNTYPQQAKYLMDRAGIATACVEKMAEFLEGNGFADPLLASAMLNENDTANDMLAKTARCLSLNRAYYWHISYAVKMSDGLGTVVPYKATLIPYEQVRFIGGEKDSYCGVKVWDDWANASPDLMPSPATMREYTMFDPTLAEEEIIACGGIENYCGQVFYYSEMEGIYPDSRINPVWAETDAVGNLGDFTNNFIRNGFSASTVLIDKRGSGGNEETRQANNAQVQQLGGTRNAGGIILLEGDIEVLDVSSKQLDKDYAVLKNSLKNDIIERFSIPQILIGRSKEGTGFPNKDELTNAFTYYNGVTAKTRAKLSAQFQKVLTHWATPVCISNDYTITPQSFGDKTDIIENANAWSVLNVSEKRNYIEAEYGITLVDETAKSGDNNESANPEQAKAQAQLRGSVGGVQGILSIADSFKRGIVPLSAALTILQEIYGFSAEVANNILGGQQTPIA